jgi:hypothetical protein
MTDLEKLLIVILAVIGAILNAILIWSESGEPFNARKFLPSIVRAAITGGIVGVGQIALLTEITSIVTYFTSFLAGMGLDAGVKTVTGIARRAMRKKA